VVHTDRDGLVSLDLVGGIRAVVNAEESRKTRRRILDRLAANAAAGQPFGGPPPFGYERATAEVDGRTVKTLAVDEGKADAIRLAVRRALDGWSLTRIAGEAGWVTRTGRAWEPSRTRATLTNPALVGRLVHRERTIEGNWEPILDLSTWEAVRAKLGGPRQVTGSNGEQRRTGGRRLDWPQAPVDRWPRALLTVRE
jgi:hypothetical protein